MSNNIYDILNKINKLEGKVQTLKESKSMDKKKQDKKDESKNKDKADKGAIAEAVKRVEESLTEKYMGFKEDTRLAMRRGPGADMVRYEKDSPAPGAAQHRKDTAQAVKTLRASGKKLGVGDETKVGDKTVDRYSRANEGSVEESGLMYHAGVKKHGKKYMDLAKEAGQKGASQEELGRLKDKHSKAYKNKKMDEGIMDTVKGYARKAGRAIAGEWNPTVHARNHFEDWIDSNPGLASHKEGLMSLYDRAAEYRLGIDNADRGETVLQVYKQIQKGQTDNLPVWATAPATDSRPEGSYQRKLAGVLPVDEGSYNEEMLSPKQKSFAALAEPKDKITYADKIAGAKKGTKNEGPEILKIKSDQAKAQGKDEFKVGDKTFPVKEGFPSKEEAEKRMKEREGKTSHGKKTVTSQGVKHERDYDAVDRGADVDTTPKGRGRPKKDKFAK